MSGSIYKKIDPKRVAALRAQGLSCAVIAERLGTSRSYVSELFRKFDSERAEPAPTPTSRTRR